MLKNITNHRVNFRTTMGASHYVAESNFNNLFYDVFNICLNN